MAYRCFSSIISTTPSGEALAHHAHTRQETARAFLKAQAQQQQELGSEQAGR